MVWASNLFSDVTILTMTSLTMEASSLLSKLKGKKKVIAELLLEDNLSDDEIAAKVKTKKEYVWKLKSEFKTKGLLNVKLETSPEEIQHLSAGSQNGDVSLPSNKKSYEEKSPVVPIQPIVKDKVDQSRKDLKIIYTEFMAGKKPPEIVARHGYTYKLVETEFRNFLKDTECDIHALQERLVEYFDFDLKQAKHRLRELADRYKKVGYLSDDDCLELIQILCWQYFEDGKNDLADDFDAKPPRGWVKVPCAVCGKPLYSAVIDPKDVMGRAILHFCKELRYGHELCHQNLSEQ